MTFRDLFKTSLKIIGAIAVGETPPAEELTDGLQTFNDMLDSWSTEDLTIFAKVTEPFTLVASQGSYTMGPSGDFNTTRPMGIDGAGIQSGASEYPMDILTHAEWENIQQKSTLSSISRKLYYETTFPLLTINVWPVPNVGQNIVIYSWKALTNVATPDDVISLPPGYNQALKYNLALLLAPEYGKMIDPQIESIAVRSLANIKRKNSRPTLLALDAGLGKRRRFNILTGD